MSSPQVIQTSKVTAGIVITTLIATGITLTVLYTDPASSVQNVAIPEQDRGSTQPPWKDNTQAPDEETLNPVSWNEDKYTSAPYTDYEDEDEVDYQVDYQSTIEYSFPTSCECIFNKNTHVFAPGYIECVVNDDMIAQEITNGYTNFAGYTSSVDLYAGLIDGDCVDYVKTIKCR